METNKMYVGISLKIAKADADYDYQKLISKKTLVNTAQLEQIKEYITEHTHEYQITDYDCNGSTRVEYILKTWKIIKGLYLIKIKEYISRDC